MTWETEITLIVRGLVGDLCSTKYTDESIQQNAVIAAHLVKNELSFTTYTIDLTTPDITPDPTTQNPKDVDFVNLVSLKSATIIIGGELKIAAGNSITVTDGPSSISLQGTAKEYKVMLDELKSQYEMAKTFYMIYGDGSTRLAVSGPTYYEGY